MEDENGIIVCEETERNQGVFMFDIRVVSSRDSCARLLNQSQLYQNSMHSLSHLFPGVFKHLHTTSGLLLCLQ